MDGCSIDQCLLIWIGDKACCDRATDRLGTVNAVVVVLAGEPLRWAGWSSVRLQSWWLRWSRRLGARATWLASPVVIRREGATTTPA